MNKPFLSVVIPVFNRPKDLERALNSLLNQSEKNFEVIVVDDGSTEDIKCVTEKYIKNLNLKFIRIDNSGGPARPRNVGIRASQADWISLLDSDDWWTQTRISEVLMTINKNKNYDIFYHQLKVVSDDRYIKWWSNRILGYKLSMNAFVDLMTMGNALPNSAVVIRKSLFSQFGYINEYSEFSSVEDFDYWLMLAHYKCKFYFIRKNLGYYWLSSTGISANPLRTIQCNKLILEKYINHLSEDIRLAAKSKFDYFAGSVLFSVKHYSEALDYFNRANKLVGIKLNIKRLLKIAWIYVGFK